MVVIKKGCRFCGGGMKENGWLIGDGRYIDKNGRWFLWVSVSNSNILFVLKVGKIC